MCMQLAYLDSVRSQELVGHFTVDCYNFEVVKDFVYLRFGIYTNNDVSYETNRGTNSEYYKISFSSQETAVESRNRLLKIFSFGIVGKKFRYKNFIIHFPFTIYLKMIY